MHGKKTSRYSNSFLHLMGFLAELCTKSLPRPAFLFVECHGKCFSLVGTFRSRVSAERKGKYGEYMGMSTGEEGETVGILITLGSRLRALPQQPRHFSRSYSAAKKEICAHPIAYSAPGQGRISSTLCLALKIQRHSTTSMCSLMRECMRAILSESISTNKEY